MLGQLDPALRVHAILKWLNQLNIGEDKLVGSLHQAPASEEELKKDYEHWPRQAGSQPGTTQNGYQQEPNMTQRKISSIRVDHSEPEERMTYYTSIWGGFVAVVNRQA
jgi:hypothetical protein